MQQAYQTIRVVSEAQTIRIGLSTDPDELMLHELYTVCRSLSVGASEGLKAIVLDFSRREHLASKDADKDGGGRPHGSPHPHDTTHVPTSVEQAHGAIRGVAQPVLGVVRDTLSLAACTLLSAADLTLVAEDARLVINGKGEESQENWISGANAARLRYVTWAAAAGDINREMERILNMLREKSAVALRFAKASTRVGQSDRHTPLENLQRINSLYLEELMRTQDAAEGLHAFLEKRKPRWHNS
jgi:hypothetical protein